MIARYAARKAGDDWVVTDRMAGEYLLLDEGWVAPGSGNASPLSLDEATTIASQLNIGERTERSHIGARQA